MVKKIRNQRYDYDYLKRILTEHPDYLKKLILKTGMSENIQGKIEVSENDNYIVIRNYQQGYELILKIDEIIGVKIITK